MKYLVIGSGPAAIFAAEAIRMRDSESDVTIVTEEENCACSPVMLTYVMTGRYPKDAVFFRENSWIMNNRINVKYKFKVQSLNCIDKRVNSVDGRVEGYDQALIATGTSPIMIPFPGYEAKGVTSLRHITDTDTICGNGHLPEEIAIIGGGFIGLKLACHLSERGIKVYIFEKENKLAFRVFDQRATTIITNKLMQYNIRIELGVEVAEIIAESGAVAGVKLKDNREIPCQRVVQAIGVRPNTDFIEDTGIELCRGGIVVNKCLETTAKSVYAAGDVVVYKDSITGNITNNATWPAAARQGRIAGMNMSGEKCYYKHNISTNALNLKGLRIISAGLTNIEEGDDINIYKLENRETYRKIIVKNNKIIGFLLLGRVNDAGHMLSLMRKKLCVTETLEDLLGTRENAYPIMPKNLGYMHGAMYDSYR